MIKSINIIIVTTTYLFCVICVATFSFFSFSSLFFLHIAEMHRSNMFPSSLEEFTVSSNSFHLISSLLIRIFCFFLRLLVAFLFVLVARRCRLCGCGDKNGRPISSLYICAYMCAREHTVYSDEFDKN